MSSLHSASQQHSSRSVASFQDDKHQATALKHSQKEVRELSKKIKQQERMIERHQISLQQAKQSTQALSTAYLNTIDQLKKELLTLHQSQQTLSMQYVTTIDQLKKELSQSQQAQMRSQILPLVPLEHSDAQPEVSPLLNQTHAKSPEQVLQEAKAAEHQAFLQKRAAVKQAMQKRHHQHEASMVHKAEILKFEFISYSEDNIFQYYYGSKACSIGNDQVMESRIFKIIRPGVVFSSIPKAALEQPYFKCIQDARSAFLKENQNIEVRHMYQKSERPVRVNEYTSTAAVNRMHSDHAHLFCLSKEVIHDGIAYMVHREYQLKHPSYTIADAVQDFSKISDYDKQQIEEQKKENSIVIDTLDERVSRHFNEK